MKTLSTTTALRILLLIAAFLPFTKANAYDFEMDGIYYNIKGEEVSVTYKGHYYTSNCYSGDVAIPSTVTYNGITYSVTSIGDYAFFGCSGLTTITIPNSITSIGNYAFCNCSGLINITIPNSVTSIGNSAFYNCSGLTSITVASDNQTYDSRNNCNAIIETVSNELIYGCKNTTIPNSVTSIGNSAFYNCSGLTTITIPNSITSIGNDAFHDCSSLTDVYSNIADPSVISMGDNVFFLNNKDYSNRRLHVPLGSIPAYRVDQKWRTFFATIEDGENVVATELKGELQVVEGGNEVHYTDTSISYDQLWISYTGDEDVEFTIIFNKSLEMLPGGGWGGQKRDGERDSDYLLHGDYISEYVSWDAQNKRYIVDMYSLVYDGVFNDLDSYDLDYYDIYCYFSFIITVHADGYNDLSEVYSGCSTHYHEDQDGNCVIGISSVCNDLSTFITVRYNCTAHYSEISSPYNYISLNSYDDYYSDCYDFDIYACERKDEDYYVTVYAQQHSTPSGIEWGETSETILIPAKNGSSITISPDFVNAYPKIRR